MSIERDRNTSYISSICCNKKLYEMLWYSDNVSDASISVENAQLIIIIIIIIDNRRWSRN